MRVSIFTKTENNEATLLSWISWYKERIPIATIYIFDKDSKDKTLEIAKEHNCQIKKFWWQTTDEWKNNCWKNIPTDCVVLAKQNEFLDITPDLFINCSVIQSKAFKIQNLKELSKENRLPNLDQYHIFDTGSIKDMNYDGLRCNPVGVFKVGEKQVDLYKLI